MAEFKKIELGSAKKPVPSKEPKVLNTVPTMKRRRFIKTQKTLAAICGILLLFLIGSYFTVVLPVQKTVVAAKKTQVQAKKVYEALKKQNIELAGTELVTTKKDLTDTQNELHKLAFLHYIPLANGYYNDADNLVKPGFEVLTS